MSRNRTGRITSFSRIGIDVDVLDGDRWCWMNRRRQKRDARPDTGVDDTDHDTLSPLCPSPTPHRRRSSPRSPGEVSVWKLTQLIRDDGDDVLLCGSFSASAGVSATANPFRRTRSRSGWPMKRHRLRRPPRRADCAGDPGMPSPPPSCDRPSRLREGGAASPGTPPS